MDERAKICYSLCMQNIDLPRKIEDKLKNLGIMLVYMFGSVAESIDRPGSDLDIGVVFEPGELRTNLNQAHGQVYDVFTEIFPGRNLDIVFLQRANLELCFDVISHGKVVFQTSEAARLDFEERISLLYADFHPIMQEFNRAVLERI